MADSDARRRDADHSVTPHGFASDRVVATQACETTGALLAGVFGRLGVMTEFVDVTDHVALAAEPTPV